MTKDKSISKYLWITAVIFVTYLFVGSFMVSGNVLELIYLFILYSVMIIVKIIDKTE